MKKYLLDASIIHGWANIKDKYHSVCKEFIEAHINDELYFPIHGLFEIHSAHSRRKKGNDFEGLPGKFVLMNKKFIDINRKFYDKCQDQKLFLFFNELKGADLIYACLAKLENLILVTCDDDFDIYEEEIKLLKIG